MPRPSPVARLGGILTRVSHRWMPDPFLFAVGLTFVVLLCGLALGNAFPAGAGLGVRLDRSLTAWKAEVFAPGALYFAFQMCLMLVTGHALASSRPVAAVVRRLAALPRTFSQMVLLTSGVACAMALVHWGLGLIVGAMIAREVGHEAVRRGIPHHYPLLGAAGYTGLMIWGGGLSGSIPLKAAEAPHRVGVDTTLFSSLNLGVSGALLLCVPLFCWLLVPRSPEGFAPFDGHASEPAPEAEGPPTTPAERIEHSRLVSLLLAALGLGWLGVEIGRSRFPLSLDNLNYAFLFLGILAQGTPIRYVRAVSEGARGCAGIILQFPIYFGILGLMKGSGLGGVISEAIVSLSNATTYPLLTYLSAGLVNLFVPSGGGQWIVQGDIVVTGARAFSGVLPKSILALTYGDAWTNMLQPFWALPLLAITGLRARDIVGYTATVMLLGGLLTAALLVLL